MLRHNLTKSQRRSLGGQIKWFQQQRTGVVVCATGGALQFMYRKKLTKESGHTIGSLTQRGIFTLLQSRK